MSLLLRLTGYRHWRVTIAFDDGTVFQSWHWMKPAHLVDMHIPVIGSRWAERVVCGYAIQRSDQIYMKTPKTEQEDDSIKATIWLSVISFVAGMVGGLLGH